MVEDKARAWRGAVVIQDPGTGRSVIRPAAFVYEIPGGAAWLEPSYADPHGAASPAWHERLGSVVETGHGFEVVAPDGMVVSFLPYDPVDDQDLVGEALEWFGRWVQAEGRSWAQERERARSNVSGQPG